MGKQRSWTTKVDEKKLLEGTTSHASAHKRSTGQLRPQIARKIFILLGGVAVIVVLSLGGVGLDWWFQKKLTPLVSLAKFHETEQKLEILQKKLKSAAKEWDEKEEKNQERFSTLEKNQECFSTLENTTKTTKEEISSQETQMKALQLQVTAFKTLLDELKAEHLSLQKKIAQLPSQTSAQVPAQVPAQGGAVKQPETQLEKQAFNEPSLPQVTRFALALYLRELGTSSSSLSAPSLQQSFTQVLRRIKRDAPASLLLPLEKLETLLSGEIPASSTRLLAEGHALFQKEKLRKGGAGAVCQPEAEALKTWTPPATKLPPPNTSWAQKGVDFLFSFVRLEKVPEKTELQKNEPPRSSPPKPAPLPSEQTLTSLVAEVDKFLSAASPSATQAPSEGPLEQWLSRAQKRLLLNDLLEKILQLCGQEFLIPPASLASSVTLASSVPLASSSARSLP